MLENDFKLYQHREIGFGAHFQIVLCLIDYCTSNNIKCFFDIRNTTYSNENQNTWEVIFQQPFTDVNPQVTIKDQFTEIPGFLNYWNLGYQTKDRKKYCNVEFVKKYKDICHNFIHVKDNILNEVNQYLNQFNSKTILGIHKRGREHLTTGHAKNQEHLMSLDVVFSLIDDQIDLYDYLFLTSDEINTYNSFKSRYGKKLLIFDDKSQYIDSKLDINYLEKTDDEKIKSLKNLIFEVLILSRCDKMLLMNSNVSHMALFFSEHFNYEFYDNHIIYS